MAELEQNDIKRCQSPCNALLYVVGKDRRRLHKKNKKPNPNNMNSSNK